MSKTFKFLICFSIICLFLAGLEMNSLANSLILQQQQQQQPLFSVQDIRDAEIMLMFGLVSAGGAGIWGAISAARSKERSSQMIWISVGCGFLLGIMGGYAIYEYAINKWGLSLSRMAIAGLVSLFISMFAVPLLNKIYDLGQQRINNLNGEKDNG